MILYNTESEWLQLLASVHPQWCDTFSVTGCCCVLFFSSDDIDHRSSHTNIAQASSVPFAPPQMPVSASMPWLGSGQTSMGASVVRVSVLHKHHWNGSWRLRSSAVSRRVQCCRLQTYFAYILMSAAESLQSAGPSQFSFHLMFVILFNILLMSTKQLACWVYAGWYTQEVCLYGRDGLS